MKSNLSIARSGLKGRFLAAIGHAPAGHESAAEAFDRLRETSPDSFPVPRGNESFWDAIGEVVARQEAEYHANRERNATRKRGRK